MNCSEEETRFFLIDPVLRDKGYNDHQRLKVETPAPVEPTKAIQNSRLDETGKIIQSTTKQLADINLLPQKILAQAFGDLRP
jgi:flagellar biosynthesis/type III secretory pathway chaperone